MILSDLKELVLERDHIAGERMQDKWQTVAYETGNFCGNMLVATEMCFPKPVTLRLNKKGWYKIYLGFIHYAGSACTHTGVRLSGDAAPSVLVPDPFNKQTVYGYNYWASYSWIEEGFWKCADLTGQDLILEKPDCIVAGTSQLCLIRLEEMGDEEVRAMLKQPARTKNLMYHCDTDYLFWYYNYKSPKEYVNVIERLEGGNSEIVIQETYFEDFEPIGTENCEAKLVRKHYQANYRKYLAWHEEIGRLLAERAHRAGMKIYAGTRMEMGNFLPPLDTAILAKKFVVQHPEFAVYTRDGRRTDILSYAYPQVRDWEIDRLLKSVERGYDGVSLFFIRGVFVGFERPVRELFFRKYGDAEDPACLPLDDPRLNECQCAFLTEFVRALRERLDAYARKNKRAHIDINVVVCYDVESSMQIGCDVETWLKHNYVDSVSQGLMKSYEDLEGCFTDGAMRRIDMDKYKEQLQKRAIFKREYHDRADTVLAGSASLLECVSRYGKDYYGALPWESKSAAYHAEMAQKQYALGVKKLISWNASHIAENLPKCNVIKNLGDINRVLQTDPEQLAQKTQYRVLSIGGKDISTYNPSWLG